MVKPGSNRSADADEAKAARPKRRLPRLLLWVAAGLAVLVALYAALGFWVAPGVIRNEALAQIGQRYHRTARLGAVRLNPFTLRLELDGFSLPDADRGPMLAFRRLVVVLSPSTLLSGGYVFRRIELDGPAVRLVRRKNGRLNLADLLPPPSKAPPSPTPKIVIARLAVRGGRLDVVDLDRPTPFSKTFEKVRVTLDDFSTRREGAGYALSATTPTGERVSWRGQGGMAPFASSGDFALSRIQVAPLASLAALPFTLDGGQLALSGRYRFALDGPRLTLAVDVDRLTLDHARLRAEGASADWVALPSVAVIGAHIDVPARTVSIGRIEAADPTVEAWIEPGGALNLGQFFPSSPPTSASPGAAAAPWKVALGEADVRGARIAFADRSNAKPVKLVLTPVDLTVTGFALPSAAPLKVALSAGLDGGGRLSASGTLAANGPVVDLAIQADRIGLSRFQPYLDRAVSLNLVSGRLSGAGHAAYSPSAGLAYDGSARIDDLRTTDKVLGQDFVDWRSLQADGLSFRLSPLSISARQVTAEAPYARVVVGPGYVLNVTDVLSGKAAPSATPTHIPPGLSFTKVAAGPKAGAAAPPAPHQGLPVEVGDLTIHGGRMDFADLTVEPHFAAGVKDLDGTIRDLSGRPDSRATVDLNGDVGRYAPVKIAGQANFLSGRTYADLKMDFHNMEMTTLSPYSGKFAGYRIKKGKLDVGLHYKIDGEKLDAEHHVVINQLQLGDKVDSANAVKLPVKLIVALLKDRHGVIDLPIAIHGTLDDPKFQYWPVIWKAVDDLLVKVATSPFDFLAKLAGGGAQLHYLTFAPGSAALTDADRQSLSTLAKVLIDRPEISLDIPMSVDPALDREALIDARLKSEMGPAGASPKARRRTLEALYRRTFGARPQIPRAQKGADADDAAIAWLESKLRASITVSDADLSNLGRARARAVRDALLGGGQVDASRVFTVTEPPLKESAGPVRMALSLG